MPGASSASCSPGGRAPAQPNSYSQNVDPGPLSTPAQYSSYSQGYHQGVLDPAGQASRQQQRSPPIQHRIPSSSSSSSTSPAAAAPARPARGGAHNSVATASLERPRNGGSAAWSRGSPSAVARPASGGQSGCRSPRQGCSGDAAFWSGPASNKVCGCVPCHPVAGWRHALRSDFLLLLNCSES